MMTNLPHSLTAAIGAILVSTTFVAAAVGPAAARRGDRPGHHFGSGPRLTRGARPDEQPLPLGCLSGRRLTLPASPSDQTTP